ncbi:RDD family protein [Microvirga sp. W0021]|uniref:RDD family protein n=1 Tax=Hohaiivirga grylli TaxID=3133970 RepID=A0ABV0BJ68_9HYPH
MSKYTPPIAQGVLGNRLMAYIIDLIVIFVLTCAFYLVVGLLGILTFGLAWFALALPGAFIGILYSTLTVSSEKQATIGMRSVGIRLIDAQTGGTVPPLNAAVHALLFYAAAMSGILLALDILIGIFRADGRLGHDLVVGVVATR